MRWGVVGGGGGALVEGGSGEWWSLFAVFCVVRIVVPWPDSTVLSVW